MPEESITESTYQPVSENTDKTTNNDEEEETTSKTPSRPVDPAVDAEGDDNAVLIIDNCESWGFVYDSVNNICVEDDTDTNIINPPVTEEPTAVVEEGEAFGFTVTPGNMHFLASWEADALVSNYTIEKWREGSSSPQETTTAGTKWRFATSFCTAHSFELVATLTD